MQSRVSLATMYRDRMLAKRLGSPSRTHPHIHTMLSKGISRTHSFLRPHISHAFDSYGFRCYALKAVSSTPAPELTLETASLNVIATSKKKKTTPKKKKLDSVTTLPASSSIPDVQINQDPVYYSYKHHEPLPTVVYTQHEEEANELITRLKAGYVFQ